MEICSGDFIMAIINRICNMSIRGIPYTKYQCLVLWWNALIPMIEPMLPPMMAMIKREDSGMRQSFFAALLLSIPIMTKETRLIRIRYVARMPNTVMVYLFLFTSCIFMARTFDDRPKRLMNPSASWWSYKSPVVNDAMLSLYNE